MLADVVMSIYCRDLRAKKVILAARWRRLWSDGYGNGDKKRPDRAEVHKHKWLLTGCSLTSRNQMRCDTLSLLFRKYTAMHVQNGDALDKLWLTDDT